MEERTLQIKRAYEPESSQDGYRVYIDRLWPRGLSHETFHYDLWEKEIAPSTELREWFHADPENRWVEFEKRYAAELDANQAFGKLKEIIAGKKAVTLLYSSHDSLHNNAVVVERLLKKSNGNGLNGTQPMYQDEDEPVQLGLDSCGE